MRSDAEQFKPLGPKVEKPPEKPADQWQPVPGKTGVERDADGKLRTNIPANNSACWQVVGPALGWWIERQRR